MALATRCPHCRTTFRVAHDQLKLRAGLVRCGACKQIFNGIENLLHIDANAGPQATDVAETPRPEPTTSSVPPAAPQDDSPFQEQQKEHAADSALAGSDSEASVTATPYTDEHSSGTALAEPMPAAASGVEPLMIASGASENTPVADTALAHGHAADDPLQRMTLMDFTAFDEHGREIHPAPAEKHSSGHPSIQASDRGSTGAGGAEVDELERTIDELQRKPWRKNAKKRRLFSRSPARAEDASEPHFVRRARRQQRYGKTVRIGLAAGCLIFFLALASQVIYAFRDQIAARFPQSRPALSEACLLVNCRVGLPAQIDLVSIESSELQAVPGEQDAYLLSALLRNRSATPQTWPHIELTLNDASEKPVARRVFQPRDYLPSATDRQRGFAANSEHTVKLAFSTTQLKASGYRIYVFYP